MVKEQNGIVIFGKQVFFCASEMAMLINKGYEFSGEAMEDLLLLGYANISEDACSEDIKKAVMNAVKDREKIVGKVMRAVRIGKIRRFNRSKRIGKKCK